MTYIFEDCKDAPLCKAFNNCYSSEVQKMFIYTNGCSRIAPELNKLIGIENEVYVYMDLVPSNKQIIRTFKKLKYFRGKFEKFIVFPIICREYYYLRSIQDTQVVLDMPTVMHCLTCKDIETNPIMKNAKDREYCTSLERLCKRVIRRALRQCAMQFSKGITYLNGDCQCESPEVDCEYMSILEKEYRLLSSFDCVPTGSIFGGLSKEIIWEECIDIHRGLVDNHNELCTRLGGENLLSIIDYMY